jgi:isoleucyl-tRNA synthetase
MHNAFMPCRTQFPVREMSPGLEALAGGRSVSMLIWTTTPWTLPANQALSVHPELDYALFSFQACNAMQAGCDAALGVNARHSSGPCACAGRRALVHRRD